MPIQLNTHLAQVLFIGSGGEVHKHALEIMGHVEWASSLKLAEHFHIRFQFNYD